MMKVQKKQLIVVVALMTLLILLYKPETLGIIVFVLVLFVVGVGAPALSIPPGLIVGWLIGKRYKHRYIGALITGFIVFPLLTAAITGNVGLDYCIYEVPIDYMVHNQEGVEESSIRLVLSQYAEDSISSDIFVGSYSLTQSTKISYWGKYNAYLQHTLFFRPVSVYAIVWGPHTTAKGYENGLEYTKFAIDSKSEKTYTVPIKMKDGRVVEYIVTARMGEGRFVEKRSRPFTL